MESGMAFCIPVDPATIRFSAEPAHCYEVQATTDLKSWTAISQTGTMPSNTRIEVPSLSMTEFPHRFYRLVTH